MEVKYNNKSVHVNGHEDIPGAARQLLYPHYMMKTGMALNNLNIEQLNIANTPNGFVLYAAMQANTGDKFEDINIVIAKYMGLRAYGDWNKGADETPKDEYKFLPVFHVSDIVPGGNSTYDAADYINGEMWIFPKWAPVHPGHGMEMDGYLKLMKNEEYETEFEGKIIKQKRLGAPTMDEFIGWTKSKGFGDMVADHDYNKAIQAWNEWKPQNDKHVEKLHTLYALDGIWEGIKEATRNAFDKIMK